ncbi:L-serine ammonia-lyase, iron-sulfur-dependent, subunit alpha [Micromonospora sp. NPDC126480]|uniref:L-serine ammonia-lyase, iron-sulfur-dependent, subunit alpha n=1 Tax=Micromonospora sp. NPDC126480 TaxID=3155312 RepID=UPI00331E5ED7
MISVFDLFSVGIGPSSSHTVGPMRAARTFVAGLKADGQLADVARVRAELFGSLGATGHGHGSDRAVLLGLEGEVPETVDTDSVGPRVERIRTQRRLDLFGSQGIDFDPDADLVLHRRRSLPYHPNGMTFSAYDAAGNEVRARTYYSVGGGFVVDEAAAGADRIKADTTRVRHPFLTGAELLKVTSGTGLSISEVMLANELSWRSETDVRAGLLEIWRVMRECVENGCTRDGVLPGGLKVRRRAAEMRRSLEAETGSQDPLRAMDWVTLFALAVNEENTRFVPGASEEGVVRFLLAAGAIGVLFKENASISGAEVGCQGEVGSACSMAAAGLAEALGGTPEQVEKAAEIGMEHNLGLTCDPVGGLVQIPCIERNAVASIKAITAARLALRGDGVHAVSLDKVIKTMRETGADMKVKYKETARGGLAVNVIEC